MHLLQRPRCCTIPTHSGGVLVLRPHDNLISLSWGTDGTGLKKSVLAFSVDPAAIGKTDTAVKQQAVGSGVSGAPVNQFPDNPGSGHPGDEAAGDIFKSPRFDLFGTYASDPLKPAAANANELHLDEMLLGLQPPKSRGNLITGNPALAIGTDEGDLDALEMDSPIAAVDRDGDGMHEWPVFFTLDPASPSISAGTFETSDILISMAPDTDPDSFDLNPGSSFNVSLLASGTVRIGLETDDVIDALVLSDVSVEGAGEFVFTSPNGIL